MEVESNPGLNAGALSPTPPSFSRLASFLTKHEQKTRKKPADYAGLSRFNKEFCYVSPLLSSL